MNKFLCMTLLVLLGSSGDVVLAQRGFRGDFGGGSGKRIAPEDLKFEMGVQTLKV